MSNDELNEKVKKAIDSNLVGEIIFSDQEMEQLRKSIPYFAYPYSYVDLLSAEKIFVYITNLTTAMEYDDDTHDTDWRSHVDPYLSFCDASVTQTRIYSLFDKIFELLNDKIFYVKKDPDDRRKRYYGTFMANALMPKASMFAFFDLCFNDVYKSLLEYEYYDDEQIYWSIAEAFKNSIKYELTHVKNGNVILESRTYFINGGLRYLSLYDSKRMAKLFQEVIYLFSVLDSPEDEFSEDNYLHQLVLDWYDQKFSLPEVKNRTSAPHERKEIRRDLSTPNVYYKFNSGENSIYLYISSFLISYSGDPHDIDLKFILYNGDTSIRGPEVIAVNTQSFMLRTTEYEICITDLIKGTLDNISLVITFNGKNIFDSRAGNQSIARDFLIFPIKNGSELNETKKSVLPPDYYYLFCPNLASTLIEIPDDIKPNSELFYIIHSKNGEALSSRESKVIFAEEKRFMSPELSAYQKDAVYILGKDKFDITDTLNVRIDINSNISEYSIACFDASSGSTKPSQNVPLSNFSFANDIENGYKIALFHLEIPKNTPYKLYLCKGLNPLTNTCTNIIFIPGFHIKYDEDLFLSDSITFSINQEGEEPIECALPCEDEIRFNFLDGELLLINPPIFKMKIGNGSYKTLSECEANMFYNDIPDSASISFLPINLLFKMYLDKVALDSINFGAKVNSLANKKIKTAYLDLYYVNKNGKEVLINNFKIHYVPSFPIFPIIQLKDGDTYKVYWNPKLFIGQKDKYAFALEFDPVSMEAGGQIVTINDLLSLEPKEIDASSLHFGTYHCYALAYHGLFKLSPTRIELGDFTYGSAGLIQLEKTLSFDVCNCSTGIHFKRVEYEEFNIQLKSEYAIGDTTKVELEDGPAYKGNLYLKRDNGYTRTNYINPSDPNSFDTVYWKYGDSKDEILLRYALEGEEYEEFYDFEQFIVFNVSKKINVIKKVKPKIGDFDILESVFAKGESE